MLGSVQIEQASSSWKSKDINQAITEFKSDIIDTFMKCTEMPFIIGIFDNKLKETRLFYISALMNDIFKQLNDDPNVSNYSEYRRYSVAKDMAKDIMQSIVDKQNVDALIAIADAHGLPEEKEEGYTQVNFSAGDEYFSNWLKTTLNDIQDNFSMSRIRNRWQILFDRFIADNVQTKVFNAIDDTRYISRKDDAQECIVVTSHYSKEMDVEYKYQVDVVPYTREKNDEDNKVKIVLDAKNVSQMTEKEIPKDGNGRFTFQV